MECNVHKALTALLSIWLACHSSPVIGTNILWDPLGLLHALSRLTCNVYASWLAILRRRKFFLRLLVSVEKLFTYIIDGPSTPSHVCALASSYVDTGAFIIHHLVDVAKMTHENVISVGGTNMQLPKFWAMGINLALLSLTFSVGSLI